MLVPFIVDEAASKRMCVSENFLL